MNQVAPGPVRGGGLPAQPGVLVGRSAELRWIRERLRSDDTRLLTLVGPAGTGKTRLAIEVAGEVADAFSDGVYFVDLSALRDGTLLASAIAQVLDVRAQSERPLIDGLQAYLAQRRILLLLDNFEQLMPAAPLLTDLLQASTALTLLVTSRSPLHLRWEQEFAVNPLALPQLTPLPPPATLAAIGSVALFIQRTQRVDPTFRLDEINGRAVAEICVRLDGLPLAIELAAARARVLPPQPLLNRLDRRLSLLDGGGPDQPVRQRTLRGAIDWSYELLSSAEQALFRRLGVFSGGFALEAVPDVCDPDRALGIEALAGVESLVDKSLVRQEHGGVGGLTDVRFGMLETIREYALERLAASGEAAATHRRHTAYYLGGAEVVFAQLKSTRQAAWLQSIAIEHDNIRAALSWCHDQLEPELGLRAARLLAWFWTVRGQTTEGRARLASLLAISGSAPGALQAEALYAAGTLALSQSDLPAARHLFEDSLAIGRELDERAALLGPLTGLGTVAMQQGDNEVAGDAFEEALAIQIELHDGIGTGESLNSLANLAHNRGDRVAARALYNRALAVANEFGNRVDVVMHNLGVLAEEEGDLDEARRHFEESVAVKRLLGDSLGLALSLAKLGEVTGTQGDIRLANQLLGESLALQRELGDLYSMAFGLERFAIVAAAHGRAQCALQLAGAASALREAIGTPLNAAAQAALDGRFATARASVRRDLAEAAWARGRAMSLDAAVAFALAEGEEAAADAERRRGPGESLYGLTPREREVAVRIAQGLTNRQMAAEFALAERTVDVHVSNILGKLQMSSRAQVAAWVVKNGWLGEPDRTTEPH
ncbi:MAG TPA: tetratricopeptide repeat protein [Chloroflexota bacterium]|nr:tetratricopeptide repeat protein [Chloroflexota bacterium]